VTYVTSASSTYYGVGSQATAVVAPVAGQDAVDNFSTTSIPISCATTQGTASASDTTLETFLVKQVK
jgi:hypothetical protein